MPEYPDITVYIEALERRVLQQPLKTARLNSHFLLRTAEPRLSAVEGKLVESLRRIGKRIAIGFQDELWLVFHLMIAGRLHWKNAAAKPPGKSALISLEFPDGTLFLTEAGTKKRASLHVVQGSDALHSLDPGGLEVLQCDLQAFTTALTATNHTLRRTLTDPHIFSGIGNAYSDEILHCARLSPIAMTQKLDEVEIQTLYQAVQDTLLEWTERLRAESGDNFPEKVTAFREDMAVHGRYGKPCPQCGTKVQRIRYASNETNYCPRCQTAGKLLADRALSRLLKKDWPRTIEAMEQRQSGK